VSDDIWALNALEEAAYRGEAALRIKVALN
jgi:hypothetical protein